jgi:purine-nucleoside phosphorylase
LDEKVSKALQHIHSLTDSRPVTGIILGSGLGAFAGSLKNTTKIKFKDIPGFPVPCVEGHEGCLVLGEAAGIPVAALQGRAHFYEGWPMEAVVFPVRVLAGLSISTLVVTNAAGGIREDLSPGSFMAITDHINLTGANPLRGLREAGRDFFVDMTGAYDSSLIDAAGSAAGELGLPLKKGVLAAVQGPCYETPAEVRMLRAFGADAVSMSSVPEVIMARYLGLKVLGISLITNRAAGLSDIGPGHCEVLEEAKERGGEFCALLSKTIQIASCKGLI